jgi:hypothetical protein
LLFVLISLAFVPAASADAYIGGSVGQATIEVDEDGIDFDEDDFAWKAFVGYSFLKFFAVEGGYVDLGNPEDSIGSLDVEAEVDGFAGYAVGKIPLGILQLYAKAGIIAWDADLEARGPGGSSASFSEDGTDPAYGVGITFNLAKLGIRLEAEMFDIEDVDDVFLITAGLEWRF